MAGLVRALLWTVVLVAPGGVLLAPWLVHREVQRVGRSQADAGRNLERLLPPARVTAGYQARRLEYARDVVRRERGARRTRPPT